MGRLSAVFIAFCMLLIAASVGIVFYLSFGFSGVEAAVISVAVMTALVMVNSVTARQRDRYDVGAQIADLSRGTADMARQVSELDRRLVAIESDVVAALETSRAQAAPLANEIGELGGLVKDLADAVAAHEQMLESAIAHATPQRPAPAPFAAPPLRPAARVAAADPADTRADLIEPEVTVRARPAGLSRGWNRPRSSRGSRARSRPTGSTCSSSRSSRCRSARCATTRRWHGCAATTARCSPLTISSTTPKPAG